MRGERLAILPLALLLGAAPALGQATFQIVNGDTAGTGLNDPTPVSPVGGNSATTLGAQQMAALQYGLSLWASRVNSSLPIRVQASFATDSSITCTATDAVLAMTGPQEVFRDDPTFPQQGVWYVGALVNELSDQVQTTMPEIATTFSGKIGTSACAFPASWYLGFDGAASSSQIDFVAVVNHEIAHGLGFLTLVDQTGAELADNVGPFPDAFEERLFDLTKGLAWPAMTDAQRAASSTNAGNLVWMGPQVEAKSSLFSSGVASGGRMRMYAPATYSDGSSVSHWDTSLSPYEALEPYYRAGVHSLIITDQALSDTGWSLAGSAPSVCTISCSASAPSTGQTGQSLSFTSSATPSNCGGSVSYSWNFGDGQTSGSQNPSHVYSSAGTYTWTLTAYVGSTQCQKTGTISIAVAGSCNEDSLTMCLISGRYRVTSYWRNQYAGGALSNLNKTRLTDATGAFWIADANTYEYMIRFNTVTDNGRAWISIPMFTDVEFWIMVQDTVNGQSQTYHSPAGNRTLIYDPFFFVYP